LWTLVFNFSYALNYFRKDTKNRETKIKTPKKPKKREKKINTVNKQTNTNTHPPNHPKKGLRREPVVLKWSRRPWMQVWARVEGGFYVAFFLF
jgi:hypothetical protein